MSNEHIDAVYDVLKQLFEDELRTFIEDGAEQPFYEPSPILTKAQLDQLVDDTHNMLADILDNKDRTETERTYEAANLLLVLSRDHMLADRSRIRLAADRGEYIRRALVESDGEDKVDGILAANIKKVNI